MGVNGNRGGSPVNALTRMLNRQAKRLRRVVNQGARAKTSAGAAHMSHLAVKLRKERAALKAELPLAAELV